MAVVRKTRREGRAIVESEHRAVFGEFDLLLEGVNLGPVVQHLDLVVGEGGPFGHYDTSFYNYN